MSSSELKNRLHKLSIKLGNIQWLPKALANSICTMEIFNSRGHLLYEGPPEIELEMELGIHRARVLFGGKSKDTLLIVDSGSSNSVTVSPPEISCRLDNVLNSRVENSLSTKIAPYATTPTIDNPITTGSVSVTLTNIVSMHENYNEEETEYFTAHFKLLRDLGGGLFDDFFDSKASFLHKDETSITFGCPVHYGNYRLRFKNQLGNVRWLPIYVPCGYHCKVIINWDDDYALDSSLIYYIKYSIDQPNENKDIIQTIYLSDYLLQTLSHGPRSIHLSIETVSDYMSKSPINPFIGIICLYLIATKGDIDRVSHALRAYLSKIKDIFPLLPDIIAIGRLAYSREDPGPHECGLPMLRAGSRSLYDFFLQCEDDTFLTTDVESYYVGQQVTSVWSVSNYEAAEMDMSSRFSLPLVGEHFYKTRNFQASFMISDNSITGKADEAQSNKSPEWLQQAVIQAFEELTASQNSDKESGNRIAEVAAKFRVLPRTVRSIVNNNSAIGVKVG